MAYTYVAAGAFGEGTGALAPGQPAGKAAGDLLLLACASRTQSETQNAAPTGWTLLHEGDSVALYGRIATNDANDAVSHDFFSGASTAVAQIAAWSGSVYTDLATIVAHNNEVNNVTMTNDLGSPALTITTDNTLVIGVGRKRKSAISNGATATSPAGLSNRIGYDYDDGLEVGLVWDYTIQTTASSLSAGIWDFSVNEDSAYSSLVVALKSAVAGGFNPGPIVNYQQMIRG